MKVKKRELKTSRGICLPPSLWKVYESAAKKKGISLSAAIAEALIK